MATRQEALRLGLKRYRSTPCKYGHDGERYTASGVCIVCARAFGLDWRIKRREKDLAIKAAGRVHKRQDRAALDYFQQEGPLTMATRITRSPALPFIMLDRNPMSWLIATSFNERAEPVMFRRATIAEAARLYGVPWPPTSFGFGPGPATIGEAGPPPASSEPPQTLAEAVGACFPAPLKRLAE